jgi:uncharacterized protein YeaO (DUF488 family)
MSKVKINIKRVYEETDPADGVRILVDRLWPRGISKEKARIDFWVRQLAPSNELRKWYGHDPEKWPEFQKRYFAEIKAHPEELAELLEKVKKGPVTFLFASKEEKLNNAHALKLLVEKNLKT